MEGIVKWFNSEHGYGFIVYKGKEIYVKYSEILDDKDYKNLAEGEHVEFDLIQTDTGLKAKNVISKKVNI